MTICCYNFPLMEVLQTVLYRHLDTSYCIIVSIFAAIRSSIPHIIF